MNSILGKGCSGTVYFNDDKTVIKIFKKPQKYHHEKSVLNDIKEKKVYRAVKMISFDDKKHSIKMKRNFFNLEEIIIDETSIKLKNIDICCLICELLLSLCDFHTKHIIHGDFKAKNIMIDRSKTSSVIEPTIIDFDLSEIDIDKTRFIRKRIDDLGKAKLLILQILYGIDYETSWKEEKEYLKKLKKDLPKLKKLYDDKEYNIEDLIMFFTDNSNKIKIWKMTM